MTTRSILVTFLGRVPRTESGYRPTRYDFGDDSPEEETAFFGWVLHKRLKPGKIIILGTTGSMWDHLFEGNDGIADDDLMKLMESVDAQNVAQDQLNELAPALEASLGSPVTLRLIPYGLTEAEQIELLKILAAEVGPGDRVHIDVTHGFRHLPMLALLAGLYIQQLKQADIAGIWYGSYDPDTGKAPVYDLSGLLRIAGWLRAFASFDKDGDYRIFTPLLRASGLDGRPCEWLDKAGYFENILNVGEATGKLRQALQGLDGSQGSLTPDARLLMPALRERLDWISESKQFEKQRELADHALEKGDYLRAVLYAYESVITRLCQLGGTDINSFEGREAMRKNYEKVLREDRSAEKESYFLLKHIRNQVAHGSRGSIGEVQKTILDETRMREFLDRLLKDVDEGKLPAADTVSRIAP